jgi:hypothetical protein
MMMMMMMMMMTTTTTTTTTGNDYDDNDNKKYDGRLPRMLVPLLVETERTRRVMLLEVCGVYTVWAFSKHADTTLSGTRFLENANE